MNRAIALLTLTFGVQIAITAHLYWPDSAPALLQSTPLTLLEPAAIDEIHIEDSKGNETRLKRAESGWQLPELDNLPADEAKAESLLRVVSSSAHGSPVADSIAARQRFRVASYHYQRRIRLHKEGQLHDEVYLGTSPGFRRVHARNDTTDAIYSIPFNTFDASGIEDDWLDRSMLQAGSPDLIQGPGFALIRDGVSWINQNGGLPEARELDALLRVLASLQVEGVANEDDHRSIAELEPDLTLELTVDGKQVVLDFFSMNEERYVFSSEYPVIFRLAAYHYDRILGLDRQLLSDNSGSSISRGTDTEEESSNQPDTTEMEQP
ncbi:MAG: DUF4340 domain-containing protein [Halioglobus sp.]